MTTSGKDRLKAIVRDRPLWVGLVVLGIVTFRILHHEPATALSKFAPLDDVYATLSEGETATVRLGPEVSIEIEPRFDEDGNPIDLERIATTLIEGVPKMLSDSEDKHGRNHPRTILPRTAFIAVLMREERYSEAVRLAEQNFFIANRPGPATAKEKLSAAGSVLTTLPHSTRAEERHARLRDLLSFIDEQADEAPAEAVKLYIDIGGDLIKSGLHEEATDIFETAIALGETHNLESQQFGAAHAGLSGLALRSGDCDAAMHHTSSFFDALKEAEYKATDLETFVLKKFMEKCGASISLDKIGADKP